MPESHKKDEKLISKIKTAFPEVKKLGEGEQKLLTDLLICKPPEEVRKKWRRMVYEQCWIATAAILSACAWAYVESIWYESAWKAIWNAYYLLMLWSMYKWLQIYYCYHELKSAKADLTDTLTSHDPKSF